MTQAAVGSTANSYEILAKLAEGGMAEIFLARGASTAGVVRHVVLKRVLPDRATDANFIRMFLDEARLAAQLQHPNIAQVYDVGKLGDSYFFTMEYIHGETLRAVLQRAHGVRRPLPIACALVIAAGVAAGLHHAHARIGVDGTPLEVVHRDVSPSNLMLSYEGGVKLVDFGVAKATDRLQESRSGTVKGKISYLSPEQARGAAIDRRSDLFSLGIVLWEMLATERLFRRGSDFETMSAIVNDPIPPPSTRRAEIPPALDELVLRLLAKSPEERFQTGEEAVDAIEAVASGMAVQLSPAGVGRMLRDLFGVRPEPWIEVEQAEARPVTLTGEPIPLELSQNQASSIDRQLSSVLDLRGGPRTVETTPARKSQPKIADAPLSLDDDEPEEDESPTFDDPGAGQRARASANALKTADVLVESADMPVTAVKGFDATASSAETAHVQRYEPKKKKPFLAIAIAISALVAIGAVVLVVATNNKPTPEPIAVALEASVPEVTPDAPVAVVELDAGVVATTPPDASPEPPRDISALVAANKFDEAITLCETRSPTSANAVSCAVAACKKKNAQLAREWNKLAPQRERAKIAAACKSTKTVLVEPKPLKPPKPDCKKNPMDCLR